MLIEGPGVSNRQFSQPALTIVQLIQTNFRKNRNTDIQQRSRKILKKKETPAALYSTLKIYGTFRSKTVIDNFFNLGFVYHMIAFLNLQKNYLMRRLKITNLPGFFRLTH